MGFLVTLAGGGHVHAFETAENLCSKLSSIFKAPEEDLLFLSTDCYSIVGDNIVAPEEIQYKQLLFLQIKEELAVVSLVKSGALIGITICDGGFGWAVVREVWSNSDAKRAGIRVGDAVHSVNGHKLYGAGHFKVAQTLRSVSVGGAVAVTFLRPKCTGFEQEHGVNITHPPCAEYRKFPLMRMIDTARAYFETNGFDPKEPPFRLENHRKQEAPSAIEEVNSFFHEYLGVHDNALAELLLDVGLLCSNAEDLKMKLQTRRDIPPFEFTEENYKKLWLAINKKR